MKGYRFITDDDTSEFCHRVTEALSSGWKLYGEAKMTFDKKTDEILGAHIIGHDAGQLIAEIVTTIEFGGSAEDIARVCHAHPTTSEAVKEAALSVDGRAIHI